MYTNLILLYNLFLNDWDTFASTTQEAHLVFNELTNYLRGHGVGEVLFLRFVMFQ